jgi:adenine-specific DNA-methyltransferase
MNKIDTTVICDARPVLHTAQQHVLDYAEHLARLQRSASSIHKRKAKGQIFTPGTVARFMANLLTIERDQIRLLDPGSGTGILIAAFCENLVKQAASPIQVTVDAYENDTTITPKLQDTLEQCQALLKTSRHEFQYHLFGEDFILDNARYFNAPLFFPNPDQYILYDVVIANPPYYKLNKQSPQAQAMWEFVHGQPNIYALFMALAVSMLKEDGQAVFITPRSFCSGVYYQKLREWLLSQLQITHIHLFESRTRIFDKDDILQENIIFRGTKVTQQKQERTEKIYISTSPDKTFQELTDFEEDYKQVIFKPNGHAHIRIPSSLTDMQVLHMIDTWPNTLHSLGLEISTGPVVHFRAKEHIFSENEGENKVPLLWMHNLQNWHIKWPLRKNGKEQFVSQSPNARKWLISVKNYVLLKRFTSKEQRRRLYASVLLQSDFQHYHLIGLENHLNYIHRPKGSLTKEEVYGLAALLNTALIDVYFRALNGNTQVNASDMRILPLPSIEIIRKIGKRILQDLPQIGHDLDTIVAHMLELDSELVNALIERTGYEQD